MVQKKADPSQELQRHASRALLSYAIFRWESAMTWALTLILVVFFQDPFQGALSFWRWWFWAILGIIAETLIVTTSLSDPHAKERVIHDALRARFKPQEIISAEYRAKIDQALAYREQLEVLLQRTRQDTLRAHLTTITRQITDWIDGLCVLVRRLENYRDIYAPQEQVDASADADAALRSTIQRAEQQLASSMDALGTLYAQTQLIGAADANGHRMQRLHQDIQDQIQSLRDVIQAIDTAW
jgi:hypothetical protein